MSESGDDFSSDGSDSFEEKRFSSKGGHEDDDFAFDVEPEEDNKPHPAPRPPPPKGKLVANQHFDEAIEVTDEESASTESAFSETSEAVSPRPPPPPAARSNTEEKSSSGSTYNPTEFNMPVSAEIRDIFAIIGQYTPHTIELEAKLKPFIPDYIPSVGEVDPFLKIPRPDKKPDNLGLQVLDELSVI